MKQVTEAQKAEADAGTETGNASTYSSEAPEETEETAGGTLASDEALAALREKLTGN
jgi:small subunit ribosomal protein S1